MTATHTDLHKQFLSLGLDEAAAAAWLADDLKLGPNAFASKATSSPAIWWQDESRLLSVCQEVGYSEAITQAFLNASQQIKQLDSQPLRDAWYSLLALASGLYTASDPALRQAAFARPGPPAERWGELGTMFAALMPFTALDKMLQKHHELNIPPQVIKATADDLPLRMEEYHQKFGQWGTTDYGGWFNNHLRGEIYMLGRLQFMPAKLDLPCFILTSKQDPTQSVAIALDNQTLRSDGLYASADHHAAKDAPDNWTTTLTQSPSLIKGHRINELGRVERQCTDFPLDQWQILVQPGDTILTVHIPARGRLETAACLDSFAQAQAFFPKYFPHIKAAAFTCVSWLMDPQLAQLEGGKSNLGKFTKLYHSVPVPNANDDQMFERVFDDQKELAKLPRDNSLRRALIAHMEQGGKWRYSGGYRLFD